MTRATVIRDSPYEMRWADFRLETSTRRSDNHFSAVWELSEVGVMAPSSDSGAWLSDFDRQRTEQRRLRPLIVDAAPVNPRPCGCFRVPDDLLKWQRTRILQLPRNQRI
jgi:hypothetical protein